MKPQDIFSQCFDNTQSKPVDDKLHNNSRHVTLAVDRPVLFSIATTTGSNLPINFFAGLGSGTKQRCERKQKQLWGKSSKYCLSWLLNKALLAYSSSLSLFSFRSAELFQEDKKEHPGQGGRYPVQPAGQPATAQDTFFARSIDTGRRMCSGVVWLAGISALVWLLELKQGVLAKRGSAQLLLFYHLGLGSAAKNAFVESNFHSYQSIFDRIRSADEPLFCF